MLCAWWAQGDATRSDTDEDKTSTHLEEDLDKFRDLRATGARVDGGQGWGGGDAASRVWAQLGLRRGILGGRRSFLGALQARVASPLPPPLEMKMYSLAVTPNGHLEGRGSLPPPLIMRTAATPMPTPKSSPHLDAAPGPLDSRRGSSSSMDPQLGDQKSLVGDPALASGHLQAHSPRPPTHSSLGLSQRRVRVLNVPSPLTPQKSLRPKRFVFYKWN